MAYDPDAHDRLIAEAAKDSPFDYRRRFRPVVVRERHDGWSPAKQADFVAALGECGCVAEACRAVGMSTESAYKLRARGDATDFRMAWQAALDYAVQRLEDAVLGRAINGVAVPHFYKGEVVGEHRRYDERLAMFLLRYRRPLTYARHWDRKAIVAGHHEDEAERFAAGLDVVRRDVTRERLDDDAVAHADDMAARAEADVDRATADPDIEDAEFDLRRAEALALRRDADALAAARVDAKRGEVAARVRWLLRTDAEAAADVARPSSTSAAPSRSERQAAKRRERRGGRRAAARPAPAAEAASDSVTPPAPPAGAGDGNRCGGSNDSSARMYGISQ